MSEPKETDKVAATLARLPSGIPANRVHGIGLWLQGHSIRQAASMAGCPETTLGLEIRRNLRVLADQREQIAQQVVPIAHAIAEEAGRQIVERLTDPNQDPASLSELNFLFGTSSDKLIAIQQRLGVLAGDDALGQLLQRLRDQGGGRLRATLELESERNEPTIDITPTPHNTEDRHERRTHEMQKTDERRKTEDALALSSEESGRRKHPRGDSER